ncbi:MAG: class I mannose-6-phosphate isomerase [Verrucomicrobiae bacterium]|nr:class I mannose-6-phosphate isomerase [Verrucomicrobiae bacterium]
MNPVKSFSEPLVFGPIYQTRVWGGRALETAFGRTLPDAEQPYGESWEVSDRPEAESRVIAGPPELVGLTLGELWRSEDASLREGLFGPDASGSGPFPLLCKILDARERLSLQVHPPAAVAAEFGGESKTEMWVVARADLGAELYVGLRQGVSRYDFEAASKNGTVEDLVHRIPAEVGDFIFIPSGRLHAIGSGLVIYEIQENSDTTYRVFDWNRIGLNGQLRQLHVAESLRCIDFEDVAPELGKAEGSILVDCDLFRVQRQVGSVISLPETEAVIVTVVSGPIRVGTAGPVFQEGDFFLVPASWDGPKRLIAEAETGEGEVMVTTMK